MKRKDAWSAEDESLLAQTVLEFVKGGKPQLQAFQSAAKKLNRTSGACSFRWNAVIRAHYESELKEAKLEAKNNKASTDKKNTAGRYSIETTDLSMQADPFESLGKALEAANLAYRQLQEEYKKLQKEMAQLERKLLEQGSGDMKVLIQLMGRARDLGILNGKSPD
ncbi:hypothetical protein E5161_12935 [Cohnella pontilimi]|uniref:Myb-like domain-containing protein n=1 Tax=Cohnella pontilimi TaxID=2564100 RepID=A0A4U0F9D6_9BACL|nr:hypothetical protein [Cohnella pontilimi]TJY41325.1 hypothetical protein E5161_12935 [Cohnella pontilimi]